MNKTVLYTCVAGALLALSASPLLMSKGHVPIDRVQVCDDKGNVKTIKGSKLAKMLTKGACRLPVCDFDNVTFEGDHCDPTDVNLDSFCDAPGSPPAIPANSAVGVTAACTNPF